MAGIQARGLQTLLGHRDGRMTARYSAPERCLLESGRRWRRTWALKRRCERSHDPHGLDDVGSLSLIVMLANRWQLFQALVDAL